MRNTTKLKHILIKYNVLIEMPDETCITLTLTDKSNYDSITVEANSYSSAIAKAYSRLLKEIKK